MRRKRMKRRRGGGGRAIFQFMMVRARGARAHIEHRNIEMPQQESNSKREQRMRFVVPSMCRDPNFGIWDTVTPWALIPSPFSLILPVFPPCYFLRALPLLLSFVLSPPSSLLPPPKTEFEISVRP